MRWSPPEAPHKGAGRTNRVTFASNQERKQSSRASGGRANDKNVIVRGALKSKPIGQHSDEAQGGEKVFGEFIVACCNATPILEAAEASLDDIAVFVGFFIVTEFASCDWICRGSPS